MDTRPHNPDRTARPRRRGFTLMEAAMVTVIVGVGTVGTLQLMAAGSVSSRDAVRLTTAVNLAKNIHELTMPLPVRDKVSFDHWGTEDGESTVGAYDDLDDFDGREFSPPLDARRQPITSLDGWKQTITVDNLDPDRLTLVVPKGTSRAYRLTVSVSRNGQGVLDQSWVVFNTGKQ